MKIVAPIFLSAKKKRNSSKWWAQKCNYFVLTQEMVDNGEEPVAWFKRYEEGDELPRGSVIGDPVFIDEGDRVRPVPNPVMAEKGLWEKIANETVYDYAHGNADGFRPENYDSYEDMKNNSRGFRHAEAVLAKNEGERAYKADVAIIADNPAFRRTKGAILPFLGHVLCLRRAACATDEVGDHMAVMQFQAGIQNEKNAGFGWSYGAVAQSWRADKSIELTGKRNKLLLLQDPAKLTFGTWGIKNPSIFKGESTESSERVVVGISSFFGYPYAVVPEELYYSYRQGGIKAMRQTADVAWRWKGEDQERFDVYILDGSGGPWRAGAAHGYMTDFTIDSFDTNNLGWLLDDQIEGSKRGRLFRDETYPVIEPDEELLDQTSSFPDLSLSVAMDFIRDMFGIQEVFAAELAESEVTAWVNIVTANDPNEKVAPAGYGDENFVSANQLLTFTIYFENMPDATAPAQKVIVNDQLSDNLDWRTFKLAECSIGSAVMEGKSYTSGRIDLGPDHDNLLLDIFAGIDVSTGTAQWIFSTIDPETGMQPENPLLGFLPPNDDEGSGEGYVSFTIRPKEGLATGTEITNESTIVFDLEASIVTDSVSVTVDGAAPESAVEPLPEQVLDISLEVSWGGEDDAGGSGLADYTIYVAPDNGAYEPWIAHTTEAWATFTGELGHIYRFYSIATDNAGNREPVPEEPDAIVLMGDHLITPTPTPTAIATPSVTASPMPSASPTSSPGVTPPPLTPSPSVMATPVIPPSCTPMATPAPPGKVPHTVSGRIFNSDCSTVPGELDLIFAAYITTRPDELLDLDSLGSEYNAGWWQINTGNFAAGWAVGEVLHIDFLNQANGEWRSLEYVLTEVDPDIVGDYCLDGQVEHSAPLVTTEGTDVNAVTLLEPGVLTAEVLALQIPHCTVVYRWAAEGQGYEGHVRGVPLGNFATSYCYPYFVSVEGGGVWEQEAGFEELPYYNLIATEGTDVNAVVLPPDLLNLRMAEELTQDIPHCTVVYRWDARNQGYEGHVIGSPLFNFRLKAWTPYFISVDDEIAGGTVWP